MRELSGGDRDAPEAAATGPDGPAGRLAALGSAARGARGARKGGAHAPAGRASRAPETAPDELDLRALLHDAVQEIEPRDGTLEHLRRAVPARRARKRQALVGMAAAALFVGTAVPALLHVSGAVGPGANPSVAGHGTEAQGGASQGIDPDAGQGSSGGSSGQAQKPGQGDQPKETEGSGDGATGSGGSTDPSATTAADAAVCTADQLAVAAAGADAPDSVGTVYGTFRFTNSSTAACSVSGPGTLGAVPGGAADATKISTARHIAGDAATALPDPSLELTSLLLQPGSSYEVKFAWVPSETCPTTGDNSGGTTGGGDPTPAPTPTDGSSTAEGTTTGTDTGTSAQLLAEGTLDGSVTVTNTAEAGGPAAQTTISGCAGTVYWTGVLAGA
ncbi:hypothetical protein [Streptomyces sp. NPDC058867]|uniref:hypothetical protein n=1 Tax=unclassified Streptomyces TaxID=2593676 RepID=UPI0036C077E9